MEKYVVTIGGWRSLPCEVDIEVEAENEEQAEEKAWAVVYKAEETAHLPAMRETTLIAPDWEEVLNVETL